MSDCFARSGVFARSERIVIVDSDATEYRRLFYTAPISTPSLCFLSTGRAAMRLSPPLDDRLWMINSELPDMPGCQLFEMLAERLEEVPVMIVGDRYRVEDELRACRAGAALYLCKPLDIAALAQWLGSRAPPAQLLTA